MVDEKRIKFIRKRFLPTEDAKGVATIINVADIQLLLAAYDEVKEKLNIKQRLLDSANEQIENQAIIIVKQHKKNYKQHKQLGEYPEVCAENKLLKDRITELESQLCDDNLSNLKPSEIFAYLSEHCWEYLQDELKKFQDNRLDMAKEEVEIEIKLRTGLGEINKILSVGLDKLKADNERLREALEPLKNRYEKILRDCIDKANAFEKVKKYNNGYYDNNLVKMEVPVWKLRCAAEAVKGE